MMTENAKEFITPLSLQTMSNNTVHSKMFNQLLNTDVEHISLAKWADIIVIAPATANIIGKFANGICDDLLTTVFMASRCCVLIAPAMNTEMLNSPANINNMEILKKRGIVILDTEKDLLACNDCGSGKMLSPEKIVDAIDDNLTEKDLAGKKFLITAGPTVEPLDPVRFLTNHSSGKMGYALAANAQKRGAEVTLITGPTNIEPPKVHRLIKINTTQDMFGAVGKYFDDCHVLIKAAAPADYKPKYYSKDKIKKNSSNDLDVIELEKNPDIAKYYGKNKVGQIIVGFAAESTNIYKYAKEKLISKNLDMIVVNNIVKAGAGFGTDTNIASIIDKNGETEDFEIMSKSELANIILNKVKNLFS